MATVADARAAALVDLSRLEGGRRQFFHEQRHAVRTRDDLLNECTRQLLVGHASLVNTKFDETCSRRDLADFETVI